MNNLKPETIEFSERRDLKSGLEFLLRTYRGKHRILDKELVQLTKCFQGFSKLTTVGEAKTFIAQLPGLMNSYNEKCDAALKEEKEVVVVCKRRADHLLLICSAYDASVLRHKKASLTEIIKTNGENNSQQQRKRVTFVDEQDTEDVNVEVSGEPMSVENSEIQSQRQVDSDSDLMEEESHRVKKSKCSDEDDAHGQDYSSFTQESWQSVHPKLIKAMKRGHSLNTQTLVHQRANKLLMDHLISVGYYGTAVELARAVPGLWQLSLVHLCKEAQDIENGLRRGDLTALNHWMQELQFRLKTMDCSDFEFDLAIFQLYLMIQRGDAMEALRLARETILPKLTTPHDLHVRTFREVMSLLAVRDPESLATVPLHNVGEERICQQFRALMRRVYGLSYPTSFALAVQLGLSNLKLPDCFDERRRKKHCLVCYPKSVNILSRHLPFMRHYNSRLYCWYTGKPMDEYNRPMLLPSGYVYSKQAVDLLTNKNNEVKCPRSNKYFSRSELLELFVI